MSASRDNAVRLWDARTGVCRPKVIGQDDWVLHMTRVWDYTMGARQTHEDDEVLIGLSFSLDGEWIMWNSEYRLWLPQEFRPVCSAIASRDLTVVLGSSAGRVLILRFSNKVTGEV